jgi:3-hydroxybutyrate dehydrogenase
VDAAIERFGRLDVVVANAGFQHVAPVADFPEDQGDALLALMLTSPFLLAKYAWEQLRASGAGRFIAVASAHGVVASPYKSGYVAAKHGVLGLVKTLALEGAGVGITASAVCPGYVRTPLVERQVAAQAQANGIPEERVLEDVILAPHALKRLIEPAEVADVIAFLAGPAGATITGVPVLMDAGWTAH